MRNTIIYQKGSPDSGELFVVKETKKPKNYRLGRFLTMAGLILTLLFVSPLLFSELKWRLGLFENRVAGMTLEDSKFAQVIKVSDLKMLNPVDDSFSLIIPKIGLNSQVLAEVPVDDKENYQEALKKGVAHAKGSYYPGQNGSIYLFGHSSNFIWNWGNSLAVFHLLNKLEAGDQLNLFYQGDRYLYQVSQTKIVKPEDLSLLKPRAGEEKLILQTCWPLGTNWKRLVVLADKT